MMALTMTMDGTVYTTGKLLLSMVYDNRVSGFLDGLSWVRLDWPRAAPGTFDQTTGQITFELEHGQSWTCAAFLPGSSCTITVTSYGTKDGDIVAGTFSGTLVRDMGAAGPATRALTNGSFWIRQPCLPCGL